jgi:hypothetical protein
MLHSDDVKKIYKVLSTIVIPDGGAGNLPRWTENNANFDDAASLNYKSECLTRTYCNGFAQSIDKQRLDKHPATEYAKIERMV